MSRRDVDVPSLVEAARGGSPRAVARLISLVENADPRLREVMAALAPHTGRARIIGLTGSPGVGKSTTTNVLVRAFRERGLRVGVLAVDPSSPFSGGALLGDRIRMVGHSGDSGVFVRSMATRGHLGGLSVSTPQAVRVLDAAGFDTVLVETVGVGQSEVEIAGAADTTLVLLAPGMGAQPDDVALVVVTKFFPASDVRLLADLGVTDVGENRHQEAEAKGRAGVLTAVRRGAREGTHDGLAVVGARVEDDARTQRHRRREMSNLDERSFERREAVRKRLLFVTRRHDDGGAGESRARRTVTAASERTCHARIGALAHDHLRRPQAWRSRGPSAGTVSTIGDASACDSTGPAALSLLRFSSTFVR